MTPESRVLRDIASYLKSLAPRIFCVKVRQGPFGVRGCPDLLLCIDGKFIALEVKAHGNALSALQKWTLDRIELAHGVGRVVYSVEDVERILTPWLS